MPPAPRAAAEGPRHSLCSSSQSALDSAASTRAQGGGKEGRLFSLVQGPARVCPDSLAFPAKGCSSPLRPRGFSFVSHPKSRAINCALDSSHP